MAQQHQSNHHWLWLSSSRKHQRRMFTQSNNRVPLISLAAFSCKLCTDFGIVETDRSLCVHDISFLSLTVTPHAKLYWLYTIILWCQCQHIANTEVHWMLEHFFFLNQKTNFFRFLILTKVKNKNKIKRPFHSTLLWKCHSIFQRYVLVNPEHNYSNSDLIQFLLQRLTPF